MKEEELRKAADEYTSSDKIRYIQLERIKSFIDRSQNEIIEHRKRLDKRTFKHPLKGKALIGRIKYSNQQLKEEK